MKANDDKLALFAPLVPAGSAPESSVRRASSSSNPQPAGDPHPEKPPIPANSRQMRAGIAKNASRQTDKSRQFLRQAKLGEGGSDGLSITETFRCNPVGSQSHPV